MGTAINVTTAGVLLALSSVGALAQAGGNPTTSETRIDRAASYRAFQTAHPGVTIDWGPSRIRRLYGKAFSTGATPRASADAFVTAHAAMFGVAAPELLAPAVPVAERKPQPLMYDRESGQYKFTAVYFLQQRDGIPVFRTRMTVLVRNQPDHPVVLVNPDVRDLGNFHLDPVLWTEAVNAPAPPAARDRLGPGAEVTSRSMVIWAGVGDDPATPRLAERCEVIVDGVDPWLLVVDAETGELLYEEHQVIELGGTGNVSGLVTEGVGAQQCEEEVETALPYLLVSVDGLNTFTDANGDFPIFESGNVPIEAWLEGPWFTIYHGERYVYETSYSIFEAFDLPGDVNLVFNAANDDEVVRSMVNAYEAVNRVRDFALRYNPDFPGVYHTDFPVNIAPGSCGTFNPNSKLTRPAIHLAPYCAFSSVAFHEYGHAMIYFAGNGHQGAYGEGMADTMSALILDDPAVGVGVYGDCSPVRNADNDCQYLESGCSTCGSAIHACGQLLSGAVWSVRNELRETNPGDALDIISNLAINAILLHSGPDIDPSIVIDYLALDDDNADLSDGTPHGDPIAAGFAAHGLFAPFTFNLLSGVPERVSPYGGDTIQLAVTPAGSLAGPEAVKLHVSPTGEPGAVTTITMDEVGPGLYEAAFPAATCPGTWGYCFYFSADTASFSTAQRYPSPNALRTRVAFDTTTSFADDFQKERGWEVVSDDNLAGGAWERAWPWGYPSGSPNDDADGSGRCFVTHSGDVDGGSTFLYSPVLDASGENPVLVYDRWFYTDGGPGDGDLFAVMVSNDRGASWVVVEAISPGDADARGGWVHREISVADYIVPTDGVKVAFIVSDTDPDSTVEAGVDGFELFHVACPCYGDVNGDGDVGFADLMRLLARWGSCDGCPEDLGGDDAVGPGDLTELLAAWGPCAVTPP